MPPRYSYWTIIAGGLPTAFRAADREELLPTFHRIREKHPDAQMKWFARGKLWNSPDEARIPRGDWNRGDRRPEDRPSRGRPSGRPANGGRPAPSGEERGRDWRPGGEHRDPRQKFVDAQKQKNAALRKERWERKNSEGDRGKGAAGRAVSGKREQDRPREQRGAKPDRPWGTVKSDRPWRDRPPRGPNREPRRNETPKPAPPPRPDEPITTPPGPPERGRNQSRRPFQPRGGYPKGPRRR